jgi:hypothetical protein
MLLGGPSVGLGDLGIAAIDRAPRWKTSSVERVGDDVRVVLDKATS